MRTTNERGFGRWIDRILATGVAIVLALQPVARAGSTGAPRGSNAARACCCSGEVAKSCCQSPAPHGDPRIPNVRREACGCALRAPIAPLALPGTAEAAEVKSSGSAWTQDWIADGARASAAMPIPQIAFGPDPPGCPDLRTEALAPDRPAPSITVLRARGIHALLASFGTLLR